MARKYPQLPDAFANTPPKFGRSLSGDIDLVSSTPTAASGSRGQTHRYLDAVAEPSTGAPEGFAPPSNQFGGAFGLVIAAIAGMTIQPIPVAADVLEELTSGWYAVEAIVFQRTGVTEANSPEQLNRTAERRMPGNVQSLTFGMPFNTQSLDPITQATLEFPVLTLNCGGADTGSTGQPDSMPAWYQPLVPETADPFAYQPSQGEPMGHSDTFDTWEERDSTSVGRTPDDRRTSHDSVSVGTIANPNPSPPHPCAPAGAWQSTTPDDETPIATPAGQCPSMALDIPLRPTTTLPICARATGRAAPAITPRLEPHPHLDWLRTAHRFADQLGKGSFRTSLVDARLVREANRIRNNGGLELLWHGRWTQRIPSRNRPAPVLVQAGQAIGADHELEGFFAITRSGLLQLQARLWLTEPKPPSMDVSTTDETANLAQTAQLRTTPSAQSIPNSDPSVSGVPPAKPDAPANRGLLSRDKPTQYSPHMVLDERRVMRKGKLHYLDHPKLGVLVRTDPVTAPDWLANALAAFESAQRGD